MGDPNKEAFEPGVYGQRGSARIRRTSSVAGHTHPESDVTSLVADLASKSATTHTHGVASGGTGLTTVASGNFLTGNGTSPLNVRTPAQARTDIGADDAGNITAGTLVVARGGTGLTTVASGSFLTGNGTGALNVRTAAQARTDIGADDASNLTSGTVADGRLNTSYTNITAITITGGAITINRATASTDTAYLAQQTGDANSRFRIQADGKIEWGTGASARDTTLRRAGLNLLEISQRLNVLSDTDVGGTLTVNSGTVDLSQATVWATYTPTVGNGGTVTWTTRSGRWRRTGPKTVEFYIQLSVNAAGSGASTVTFDLPSSPKRTLRQTFAGHSESPPEQVQAACFTGGSGATVDRILRISATVSANMTGADLTAGRILTIQGTYEEA